ncbi:hypothetical protein BLNAU_17245 [Blattamonas nauphoetae]|uniref:Uncharacterized protein n=1 Tax=Blattamonas nauphoetae TaxID=2049346 RepID=A0ABQ9X946_9EUKA|nr:hypothetical protein BLNAU_17245 [Blattamonas nauphoetae]
MDETVKESKLLPLENSSLRDGTSTAPTQQHLACVTSDNEKEALTTSASVKYNTTGILKPSPSDYLIRQCRELHGDLCRPSPSRNELSQVFKGDIADHITPARLSRIGHLIRSNCFSANIISPLVRNGRQCSHIRSALYPIPENRAIYQKSPFRTNPTNLRSPSLRLVVSFSLTTTRSSLKTQQTHRTLQERRIANSSTKPGSLSASLSLVEGLLQKDGQKYNQTGFKVRGERVEDMLAEDTLTVAVTTEPALVCDLSFEVDTGTQKTWKSWN